MQQLHWARIDESDCRPESKNEKGHINISNDCQRTYMRGYTMREVVIDI
jgi:hypothetical protein